MNIKWEGIFTAIWTPTDREGRILERELEGNVALLRKSGVHGVMALGSTGEFLYLDVETRKKFLERVINLVAPLPVIANISDLRPRVVAELAETARQRGAAGVAVLPPYFFPVAQDDLVEFFVRAGETAQLPLFLYNFPERTGNRISLETVAAVAQRIKLAGIKQSGGEFEYHRSLVQLGREKNFVVFTGSDTRLPDAMSLGVCGCVSGLSNAVPDLMVQIFDGVKTGAPPGAVPAIGRMEKIGSIVDQIAFPLNVAAAMEARGLSVGQPKSLVSPGTQARYQKLVREFQGLFREWKLA